MKAEKWERFRSAPGDVRDKIVGLQFFHEPNRQWELAEAVVTSPASEGSKTDEYTISFLLDSAPTKPNELDRGVGKFRRVNRPGELTFTDHSLPRSSQGVGPFHTIYLAIQKKSLEARINEMLDGRTADLEVLLSRSFRDESLKLLLNKLLICTKSSQYSSVQMAAEDLVDEICNRMLRIAGYQILELNLEAKLHPNAIQNALDYMHSHFTEDLTRDQLAQIAGVHSRHFTRLFKQTLGITPSMYLLTLRLKKAEKLLTDRDHHLSVSAIAAQCGFFDKSHLSNQFKRYYGLAPDDFRRGFLAS